MTTRAGTTYRMKELQVNAGLQVEGRGGEEEGGVTVMERGVMALLSLRL